MVVSKFELSKRHNKHKLEENANYNRYQNVKFF